MQLSAALTLIQRCCDRMQTLYGEAVFDEWVIVALSAEGASLAGYQGPRADHVKARFVADTHELRQMLRDRPMAVGEFVFAPAAGGTAFDACIRVGEAGYLLFNHTQRTMEEIRRDPRWLGAQKPFVELTETFRADPLR